MNHFSTQNPDQKIGVFELANDGDSTIQIDNLPSRMFRLLRVVRRLGCGRWRRGLIR